MQQRKQTVGVVQLEWVCPNCETRNPGPVKTCKNCGAPQPENVKFQRAADEKLITDTDTVEKAKAGADIHCGFCGTRNPATATNCSQCGADLKEGNRRQSGEVMEAAPAVKIIKCNNCGTDNPSSERNCKQCGAPLPRPERPAPVQASVSPAVKAKRAKTNWLLFGGIGAFLAVCCAFIFFMFILPTKSVQGTVTDVHWETYVPVQQVEAVNYTNERGSPPSDAYNVSCRTETQEVCEEKTVDQGNGYAEVVKECHNESEDYCSYTRDEWKTIQTYTLQGSDLFPVYDNPSVTSGQRVGPASETFTVTFNTSNGDITYTPGSESEFQQFQIGSTWTLNMNAAGGILSVEK